MEEGDGGGGGGMEGEEREGSCGLQEVSPQCLVSHSRRGCSWRTEAPCPWLGRLLSGFQDPGQARPAVSPGGAPRPEHLPFQAVIPTALCSLTSSEVTEAVLPGLCKEFQFITYNRAATFRAPVPRRSGRGEGCDANR